jgi:hypothetical protein
LTRGSAILLLLVVVVVVLAVIAPGSDGCLG